MKPNSPKRKRGHACRFPDSVRAAEIARVSREHLYRVLIGERASNRVVQRLAAANHPLAPVAAAAQTQLIRIHNRSRRP